METENVERYGEVKNSKKTRDYTGFTNTGVYTKLLPVVKDLFVRFENLDSDSSLSFLWSELRVACLNSLTGIIVGFNKYHSRDKVRVYNSVKSNIGRMQGIIILLSELKKISVDEGIPIGNLTSQLFANIYLNELDYYVKHDLGVKYYLRYMDDFIVIHKSKSFLGVLKSKIKVFFESLKLSMHPKKANVFPLSDGVDFLGYRVFNGHRLARKSTVFRFLRNTKKKIRRYHLNEISFDKLLESFNSWFAYLGHANTFGLRKSLMARYHKNVF